MTNMRIGAALGLVLFIALAPAFPATPSSPSFLGEWTATAHATTGDTSETVKVTQTPDGYAITAKLIAVSAGTPEAGPGEQIVLDGDHFSYQRKLSFGDNTLVITYTGVVSGDTFTGTVDLGGLGKFPYTGVRIKHNS